MANLFDYLDWRGDLTLAERGFNEVDNLLMAELCFLDFSGIVPADFSAPVSLPEAMQKYDAARPQETMGVLVPADLREQSLPAFIRAREQAAGLDPGQRRCTEPYNVFLRHGLPPRLWSFTGFRAVSNSARS